MRISAVRNRIKLNNFYTFIFLILYLGILMSVLGLSGYIPWLQLSLLFLYWIYRAINKVNVQINAFHYVLFATIYFISFTCLFILLSGTNVRAAFQNTLQIISFYLLAIGCLGDREKLDIDFVIRSYIKVASVASVANICLTVIGLVRGERQEGYRVMLTGVVVGLYVMLMYRRRNSQNKVLVPCILAMVSIVVSYSKQAYLSLVVLIFLLVITSKSIKTSIATLLKVATAVVGAIIVVIIAAKFNSKVQTIVGVFWYNMQFLLDGEALIKQESYRITEMREAFLVFRENVWFGIGSGTKYTAFGLENWVHNNWLWFLLDFGIVGTCIFILPIIKQMIRSFVNGVKLKKKNYEDAVLCFIPVGGMFLLFFNALFGPVFFRDPMSICIMAMLCGIMTQNKKAN